MAGNNSFVTSLLALFDDNQLMKDVTSKPCSGKEIIAEDYLSIVEKILDTKDDQGQIKSLSSPTPVPLSSSINELGCQITCEALHTDNVRQTMVSLFNKLSSFSWNAKAVLTLSALSVYYAENWHLAQSEKSDYKITLAAVLRGPRAGMSAFVALKDLIRVTLEFANCTVEFENSSKKIGALTSSIDIRASFYQVIVAVFGCSVLFSGMISASKEFLRLDLSPFLKRVTEIHISFKKEVDCYMQMIAYNNIKRLYKSHTDIVEFMTLLFCTEKDSLTVNQGFKKTTVKVESLQNKKVMLLISDWTLSNNDIITLNSLYNEERFKSSNYEIIWVPIADVKDDILFQKWRSQMPWYSCNSIVSKAAAKFIKKFWQFKQQTKLVVMNEVGELVNMDAMMMIRLWGSKAQPFTLEWGCQLWDGYKNNWLKLVVNNTVCQYVEQSFERRELIFLYGSAEDSEIVTRIEKHLSNIKSYVSFSFKSFNINTKREQFHFRIESCISSKMQVSMDMSDPLTQEQLEVYTNYKKKSGFAIFAEGPSVIFNISLKSLVEVLSQHEKWIKKGINKDDFCTQFRSYYDKLIVKPQCIKFKIPNMVGNIPEYNPCPKDGCRLNMENVVTFKCCHGKH